MDMPKNFKELTCKDVSDHVIGDQSRTQFDAYCPLCVDRKYGLFFEVEAILSSLQDIRGDRHQKQVDKHQKKMITKQ